MTSAFEITFLGTGTSLGVPVIGCHCAVCRSQDPRNKRTRAAILVRTAGGAWLVDAGPDIRAQILREGIESIDAVLITHTHSDHIMGLDDLRRFSPGMADRLPVYATPESMAALKQVFAFAFTGENMYPGYLKPEPREITGPFSLGGARITPLPVAHGKVDTIGFLFESKAQGRKFAYISDCKAVPPATAALMGGLEVLIIDALRYTPHPTHMNFDEALAFAAGIAAQSVWFTHISCEVDHGTGEAGLPPDVRIAYDGLRLQV